MLLITPAVDVPVPSELFAGAANCANSVAMEVLVTFAG